MSIEDKYDGVKELINLGKEKGYLLYDEVNDVLPDDIHSSEDLDNIFYLFGDAGIELIDSEQEFESVQKKIGTKTEAEDEDQDVDLASESLEKTNDPVRMYLREMGTVPLLTREGEVEIAKRIEKGQKTVLKALSRSPVVVAEILNYGQQLVDAKIGIKNFVNFSEDELTDEILEARLTDVLARLGEISNLEGEACKIRKRLRKATKETPEYKRMLSTLARYRIPIARHIRDLDLTAGTHDQLVNAIKRTVDRVVTLEREIKHLKKLQETPLKLEESKKVKLRLREAEKELREIEEETLTNALELKRTLATIKQGELEADIAKKELVEANLQTGGFDCQEVHEPRSAVPGSDSGRQHRADEGGRQVRVPARLQVLDLRDLVDPPGDYTGHRGSGPHHPYSGPHDRDHQQADPDFARTRPGIRPRADF